MSRCTTLIRAAAISALATSYVHAADIFWQGGSGTLLDSNYSDGTNTGLTPAAADVVHIGNSGTVTFSGTQGIAKLRVGHNQTTPGGVGAGTLTVNGGALLDLTPDTTLTGAANALLWVGAGQDGTLNIDGSGTQVISRRFAAIGYGNDVTKSGTVNITDGGSLSVTAGNVSLGERTSGAGVPGHVSISGTGSSLSVSGGGADLNVGEFAKSTFTQTGGATSINDQIIIGQRNTDNTTFSVSGGTLSSGGAMTISNGTTAQGNSDNVAVSFTGTAAVTGGVSTVSSVTYSITVGMADAKNTSLTIGDTATLSTPATGVIVVGRGNALNSSMSVGGNAVLNLASNITVGTDTADGSSLTVSGNADINIPGTAAAGNIFVGRVNSKNTTFTMTGGTIDLGNHFLMGTATTPGATNIVGIHSGGTITTTNNFVLADSFGASTYTLSGAGAINANGLVIVGRQSAAAVMNQTGGTVTAALGVNVGNAQNATTSVWGTGTYSVSGGTITANQTTGTALSIAPQGTGTFRVIGDDATIDVNGNLTVNAGGSAQGTLAYQLETGDLLSMIDVSGNATFIAGAILNFDTSLASATQNTYDLLTAVDVIDNGISFSGPAGWNYQIVAGGNGEILQAFLAGIPGDYNNNGFVDAADYVLYRKDVTPLPANEVDNIGTTDDQDWVEWKARFGNPTPGSGGGELIAGQVPEPAAAGLVIFGLIGLASMGCRTRRHQGS